MALAGMELEWSRRGRKRWDAGWRTLRKVESIGKAGDWSVEIETVEWGMG